MSRVQRNVSAGGFKLRAMLRHFALLTLLAAPLAACSTTAGPEEWGTIAPEGSAVPLRQSVRAGSTILTPVQVVEDSRCPANARCVWAGRVILRTRVESAGGREVVDLTLGEPREAAGRGVALTSVAPAPMAGGRDIADGDYRFTFDTAAPQLP